MPLVRCNETFTIPIPESSSERTIIQVPERVTQELAEAAARAGAVAVEQRDAAAAAVSTEIFEGAQAAGIDIGELLYDENGNVASQQDSSSNSQAGLAAHY